MIAVVKIFKFFAKLLFVLFALMGIFATALILLLFSFFASFEPSINQIPEKFAIVLNLDQEISEKTQDDFFSFINNSSSFSLKDISETIKSAANDPKVVSLIASLNSSRLGLAQSQELGEAIDAFNRSEKNSIVYSETIGLDGYGTNEYYLASNFKEIWLQPTGTVNITGIFMEAPFFKTLLQKIGIKTDFFARYEYKGGAEHLNQTNMSSYVKQNMDNIVQSLYNQIVDKITNARNIAKNNVINLINDAPLSAKKALLNKLVDKLAYRDELEEKFTNLPKISLEEYILHKKNKPLYKDKIALIYINGMIVSGTTNYPPFGNDNTLSGADDITEAIYQATLDKNVKAIVIRINSPGGSYTASDAIWHSLEKVKEKYKIPVVASLGNVAASGGYFVAMAADKILANPATITGSIGVFGGKINLHDLWEKIGISWDTIQKGQNADFFSFNKPFSQKQRQAFEQSLDDVYNDFTQKVAKARNLSAKEVDNVARGRIFTGEQAVNLGLVDEIGSLSTAIQKAKELAKIDNYSVVVYPKPKNKIEQLNDFLQNKNLLSDIGYRFNIIFNNMHLFSPIFKTK